MRNNYRRVGGFGVLGTNESVSFVYDVPQSKKPWAEIYEEYRFLDGFKCMWMTIHVHSANEINGGGWDRGKFGSGQNVVIE